MRIDIPEMKPLNNQGSCPGRILRELLLTSKSLSGDPVLNVPGTMNQPDAFDLTCCQKANALKVDQAYFVQVERDARASGLYLCLQFFYMLPPHAAD